jgi:hypothetical protein
MPKKRACVFCGCTEDRACVLDVAKLSSRERGILRDTCGDFTGDLVGCRWISLDPPVCSAPACAKRLETVNA